MSIKIYLNVNCSTTTYETEPSNAVWFAVQKAKAELVAAGAKNVTQEILERWLDSCRHVDVLHVDVYVCICSDSLSSVSS